MTTDYSTPKFDGAVSEKLYEMSCEGMQDGEIGSVDDMGWHGIFVFNGDGGYIRKDFKGLVGAILREDSQGFVTSEVFTTMDALNAAIAELEAEYVECYQGDDE